MSSTHDGCRCGELIELHGAEKLEASTFDQLRVHLQLYGVNLHFGDT
jgi:hypothetical protein